MSLLVFNAKEMYLRGLLVNAILFLVRNLNNCMILSMRKILFVFLFCANIAFVAKADNELNEIVIIGKDTLQMVTCPISADSVLRTRLLKILPKTGFSAKCWRGYQGVWRVENDTLYLERVLSPRGKNGGGGSVVDTRDIFAAYKHEGRIVASWFSGEIKVVQGKRIPNTQSMAPKYEKEKIYCLERGRIVSQ